MIIIHDAIDVDTGPGINIYDITPDIRIRLQRSDVANGYLYSIRNHRN